ncbi:MAG: TonB-dependent receptor [Rikenellaceae bacterium]
MKRHLLSLLFLLAPLSLLAQGNIGNISLRVLDAETGTTVPGAIIELTNESYPDRKLYYSTEGDGQANILQQLYGDYKIKVTYIGYEDAEAIFTLQAPTLVLQDVNMFQSSTELDVIVKEIQAIRTSQKGDTLSYNANSFKVAADADVEGLMRKMPGITIENGSVTAQGETIQKIYVDGREFFGDDVATALKSLPAEVVEKIELYNKASDESEASGVDDGNSVKSINIVTKPSMRKGVFGKVYAGYGYEPNSDRAGSNNKYISGGNINLFREKQRLSVVGFANNINQKNFSFEDIVGASDEGDKSNGDYVVSHPSGVADIAAIGINYSDAYGEKDKLKIQASYFFNQTETINTQYLDRWYEEPASIDTLTQVTNSITENSSHRLNARIEWKINDKQSILFRPNFSFQNNKNLNDKYSERYGESKVYDNGERYTTINENSTYTPKSGYNLSSSLIYRLKASETVDLSTGFNFRITDYDSQTNTVDSVDYRSNIDNGYTMGDDDYDDPYKLVLAPTYSSLYSAYVSGSKKFGERWTLNASYRLTLNHQETIKKTYDSDEQFNAFEDMLVTSSSSEYISDYVTHKAGPGFRYGKGKTSISGSVNYQYSTLDSYAVTNGVDGNVTPTIYENVVYNVSSKIAINAQNNIRIDINSYTSNPAVSKLQPSYNTNNESYISRGNEDLVPSYSQRLWLRYIRSSVEKGRTFMIMGYAQNISNYIGSQISYDPGVMIIDGTTYDDVEEYSVPVNMDGYWRFYSKVSYGIPISPIRCNLNLTAGYNYILTPSVLGGTFDSNTGELVGGALTQTDKATITGSVMLGSNISENVDFTVSWNGYYNEATNSSSAGNSSNRYYEQNANATLKLLFLKKFTCTASASYRQSLGITNDYNVQYTVCNLFIGRKLFKQNRGEVFVGVNDILDQNTDFWRGIGSSYTQNVTNSVVGRFFSVQFAYNLRFFGNKASREEADKISKSLRL